MYLCPIHWEAVEAVGVWFGAAVALLALRAAWKTVKDVASQAASASTQAVAASAQAIAANRQLEAMQNSERARLAIEFLPMAAKYGGQWYRLESYGPVAMSEDEILDGKYLSYQLKVTNMGRTVGEIFTFQLSWGALNEGKKFSADGLSRQEKRAINEFLGGGESRVLYQFNTEEMFGQLNSKGKDGAVCATVEYGDVVSPKSEREHKSFVFYLYPKSTDPLERVNGMTSYL